MSTPHRRFLIVITALALVALGLPSAATGQPPRGPWPQYIEDGDRTPPVEGLDLVDDLHAIRRAWVFERHMGVGKGLYPGNLRQSRRMGLEPFQGGASSPVIANGTVFVSYYKPDGQAPAKPKGWRTVSDPTEFLPDWFFSVTADDVLLAVDARTGKLLWERVDKGKGLNRLSHKRGHWGVSPACAEGVVFHLGSMGRLYATRIADGKRLWETATDPHLEKTRAEHIANRELCWDSEDRSSLVTAEGMVIVPRGRLHAYDAASGAHRWSTDRNVQSGYGTPSLWRHDGRTYLLANSGQGQVRLIDPRDGTLLWTQTGLGPFLGTLSVTGDRVILNGGTESDNQRDGLFAMYRLSLDGASKLWQLPDKPIYRHQWTKDAGPRQKVCLRDGLAYIPLSLKRPPKGLSRQRLIVADAQTGRIHTEAPFRSGRQGARPILLEDKILMIHDDAHSDPVSASWWTAGADARQLAGDMGFPHVAITAYCTPIVQPYADGRIVFRSLDGLVCYDLRKPADASARTIHLTIPDELAGPRGDLHVSLYTQAGQVTRGGIRGGSFIHNVDVSPLRWDGRRLTGRLGIDLPATRKSEYYRIDARADADGTLTGTVTLPAQALDEPIDLAGGIRTMTHQPAWQPPCDYVLWLEGAAFNRDRKAGRLLLFVTVRDGEVTRLDAWADRTTKTRPVVYPEKLELRDGTLHGTIVVRYRADEWTRPLTAGGPCAAGRYTFQARLVTGDHEDLGTYTGTYGIGGSRSAKMAGRVED